MIKQEWIRDYFLNEIESYNHLFLYKDKQLLKKGMFAEFAEYQLSRAKKTYWGAIAQFIGFSIIGFIHLMGMYDGIADLLIGFFCITASLLVLHFATKEYYKIRGSMMLLQKLLEGEEIQSEFNKTESKVTV